MRIMFLNQSPADPDGSASQQRLGELLQSYASHGPDIALHYPDDYAGGGVMDRLGEENLLNGLNHWMETPALVKIIVEAAEQGFDAVIQSNTFDPSCASATDSHTARSPIRRSRSRRRTWNPSPFPKQAPQPRDGVSAAVVSPRTR